MGRWQDLVAMLAERRLGFRIDETMKGTHRYLHDFEPGLVRAGTELPFSFHARWGHAHLERFLNPTSGEFLRADLEGTVTAGGLCLEAPMQGRLELRYFQDASIRYVFEFEAHGKRWRYAGEKRELRPWNLHRTHTTCHGSVTEVSTDEALSDSVVRFDLADLPHFVSTLRLG